MSDTKLLISPISFVVSRLPDTQVEPFQPTSLPPIISFSLGAENAVPTGKQHEAGLWKQIVGTNDLYRFETGISHKFTQKPVKPSYSLPPFITGKEETQELVKVTIRHSAYFLTGTFDPIGLPCGKKKNIYLRVEDAHNKYFGLVKICVSLEAFGVDPIMFEAGERVATAAAPCRKLGEILRDGVLLLKKTKEGVEECTVYHGIREAIDKELQSKASTIDITLCVFKGSYSWHKPIVIPSSTYSVNISIIALNQSDIIAEDSPLFIVDYLTEFVLNINKINIPLGSTSILLRNCLQRKVPCAVHVNCSEIGDIKADSGDITGKVAVRQGMRLHALNETLAAHSTSYSATIYHCKYPILTEFFGSLNYE